MIASTVGTTVEYILREERDQPESKQTVFLLRMLPKKATAIIMDNLVGYDTAGTVIVSRPGTGALTAVKLGLAGWRNMHDEDGNPVRPHIIKAKGAKRTGMETLSPKSIDRLPQYAVDELGGEIMEINGLTTEGAEEEQLDDDTIAEEAAENPTDSSTTETDSSSSPPSPPTTPSKAGTGSSDSSAPAASAPAKPPSPAPQFATPAGAKTG